MIHTDELIRAFAADLKPVPPGAVQRRIAIGISGGGAVTLFLIAMTLGFRPDLGVAMRGFSFWMKVTYTVSLAACAIAATVHLSRPDAMHIRRWWPLALPVGGLMVIAMGELLQTPSTGWLPMWLGRSWKICALLVFSFAMPLFAGLLWAFRQLAPARLRLAGAAAGLASGACAATLYCLHCPEVSALFVLTWYTLGMALAALGGAMVGPRLLRW